MDEEESDIFDIAQQVFDKEQASSIGQQFIQRKIAELEFVDEKAEKSLEE